MGCWNLVIYDDIETPWEANYYNHSFEKQKLLLPCV